MHLRFRFQLLHLEHIKDGIQVEHREDCRAAWNFGVRSLRNTREDSLIWTASTTDFYKKF